ncbi:MAG: hypothetical protein KAU48_01890 [Candidatus Thorarchaeota archaeon]|nr:hypothetical protein [Candidatus Thorarchaeota archaeon]
MINTEKKDNEKEEVNITTDNYWKKFVIFLAISVLIDLILHFVSPFGFITSLDLNIISATLGVPVVASIYIIIDFAILAFIFVKIQGELRGSKIQKGLAFGISMGGFFFIGMLEMVILWDSPFWAEIYNGFADCIPLIILGFLLGKYLAEDSDFKKNEEKAITKKEDIIAILVITIFYLIGRYFQYYIIQLENVANTNPVGTFLWTLGIGIWIALSYVFLSPKLENTSHMKRAIWFGVIIFGINWILYHLFIPALFDASIFDVLPRALIDMIFVIIAIYVVEKIKSTL